MLIGEKFHFGDLDTLFPRFISAVRISRNFLMNSWSHISVEALAMPQGMVSVNNFNLRLSSGLKRYWLHVINVLTEFWVFNICLPTAHDHLDAITRSA